MNAARHLVVVVAIVVLAACGPGGDPPGAEVLVLGSDAPSPTTTLVGLVVGSDAPSPTTTSVGLVGETTTVDPAGERGLDADAAENRVLRATLPELPGATLVSVEDALPTVATDAGGPSDAMTTWTYELQGSTKCGMTGAFEVPMAAAGWIVQTLETPGLGGPDVGNIRASELYRDGAFVSVTVDAPPRRLFLRIEARSGRIAPGTGDVPVRDPWPCLDVLPVPPPDPPDADRAAEVADNEAVFATLPMPDGATVVEHIAEGAIAMGMRGQPIGYGSYWRLSVPGTPDPCAIAAIYEDALGAAGWERFTFQRADARNSMFFAPPRSVEVEINADGTFMVLVMAKGAIVGTRQYPGERVEDFVPGATPESRGESVLCTFG